VMPAHVIYPRSMPARQASRRSGLKQILRGRLRFDGAVFSDDLSMEAARSIDGELLSYHRCRAAALEAGCDLALLCNQSIGEGAALDEIARRLGRCRRRALAPDRRSEHRRRPAARQRPPTGTRWSNRAATARARAMLLDGPRPGRDGSAPQAARRRVQVRQVQPQVELQLVVVRLHVRRRAIEGLVVVRSFMCASSCTTIMRSHSERHFLNSSPRGSRAWP
jgi:beta-glucosidase-like glycosyl hydrolase